MIRNGARWNVALWVWFLLSATGQAASYYVNDAVTNGDVYCVGAGNDTNSGTSPFSPMLTITNLIATKDIEPGDTVYIDTGTYYDYTVYIDTNDAGSGGVYATYMGSTNFAAGGSVIDRRNTGAGTLVLAGASYVQVQNLTLRGGASGLAPIYASEWNRFIRITARNQDQYGVYVFSASHNNQFIGCVLAGNSSYAARVHSSTNVSWQNCTFWNPNGLFVDSGAETTVSNSIVRVAGGSAFYPNYSGRLWGDYNILYLESGAVPFNNDGTIYPLLSQVQASLTQQLHSCVFDPQLANPANFDFHPMSQTGRYVAGVGWTNDTSTSGAVDMGYPYGDYSSEPTPNGSRLNVGFHGNSIEASKSPTNTRLRALTFNDGGMISGTGDIYWVAVNFSNTATVRVEYSPDDGAHWSNIATGVRATNETLSWNTMACSSSARARWRVTSESDSNTSDQVDHVFSLRNTNLFFYVNDTNRLGDMYCAAAGSVTNNGTTPDSPLLSLQDVLDRYVISGGDVIYVDTGNYVLTNTITIGLTDAPQDSVPLTIQGSTNDVYGGTLLDMVDNHANVIYVNSAQRIRIADVTLARGQYGLQIYNSPYFEAYRVVSRGHSGYGFFLQGTSHNSLFDHCIGAGNSDYGVRQDSATNCIWRNCVFWNTKGLFFGGGKGSVSNSILRVSASPAFYVQSGGTVLGDYNIFHLESGAYPAYVEGITYNTLADYQKGLNRDWHSTVLDPLFALTASNDFHLKSQNGRWTGSVWTNDSVTSPAIDFGDPTSPYTNEPSPNGSRIDAGFYGNTLQASKSTTNAWLRALTFNDGGTLNVPGDAVYWTSGNLSSTATVRIELSLDAGVSWEVIETNILVSSGMYVWANTNFDSSRFARWRVVYESNTNVYGATLTNCVYRKDHFSYYVNDSSSYGDIYCTGLGNDSNLGSSRGSPKATLKSVLDENDLEPGDIVYVDTGWYRWSQTPVIGVLDSGSTNQPVVIQGSTNELYGGTLIEGFFLSIGIDLNGGQYIDLRNVAVTNAGTGIRLVGSTGSRLYGVVTRDNRESGLWLSSSDGTKVQRCVSAENGSNGVWFSGGTVLLENSVLWNNEGAGVWAESGQIGVSNTVVVASGDHALCYYSVGTSNIVGDYNDLYTVSNGVMGYVASLGRNLDTLSAWSWMTANETHSLGVDPLFADPEGGDFHLKSETSQGRFVPGVGWVLDAETSLLIDSGNPTFVFTNEPAFNGNRINIGLHGNYSEASKSRTNGWLHAASLRQGGWVKGTSVLHWVVGGTVTGHTVRIEYSPNGGQTWTRISPFVGPPATNEQFSWDTTKTNDTPAGLWKVVDQTNTNIWDQTTNFFAVRNTNITFYVNDASTNGDLYTSAVGSPTNWVASTNRPLQSLSKALSIYDIEPGDTLYVDTGVYTNTVNARINRLDSGSSSAVVRIVGSTNESAGGSVLYRSAAGAEDYGLHIDGASWLAVSNLTFRDAGVGLVANDAAAVSLGRLNLFGNAGNGLYVVSSSNLLLSRVVCAGNGLYGLSAQNGRAVSVRNSVVWSNRQGGVYALGGDLTISNSIAQASGTGHYVYELASNAVVRSDYNCVEADDQATVSRDGGTVSKYLIRWQQSRSNDVHSLSQAPQFADAPNGDYHVRSQAGRFSVAVTNFVTTDTNTSYLIDSGDPAAPYSAETAPNGGRLNIGLYGNDGQASRSRTNGWLLTLSLNDGGNVRGTNSLYWVAGGAATGQLVYIDYSYDGGLTWSNVATNVSALAGTVEWDTSKYRSTSRGRWRVVSQSNPSVRDETDVYFALNNDSLSYYVNDTSTIHDVYCSMVGSSANDGLSSDSPLSSIQEVVDRYDLLPGDRILVDTGTYPMSTNITIGQATAGLVTNLLVIQGSTNWACGGTILDRQNGQYGIVIERTEGISLRSLNIANARIGVRMFLSTNCVLDDVKVQGGYRSFELDVCCGSLLTHCVAYGASTNGLLDMASSNTIWQSGVLWSNGWSNGASVRVTTSLAVPSALPDVVTVRDSVIGVFGNGAVAYQIDSGSVTADYNNVYLGSGSYAAQRAGTVFPIILDTVSRWSYESGQDRHSLSVNPLFFSPETGDFHLLSQSGRYDTATATYVPDSQTSPLIDAGNPADACTNEPLPNGNRINIGEYGNTSQASKSPTNAALQVITLNDGGRFEGTNYLYWVAQGVATGHTLTLAFSADNGLTWTNIATNVPASAGGYLWDSTKVPSTLFGRWLLRDEQNTALTNKTAQPFSVRNARFVFYVNNDDTNGDVYCTAVGNATNWGLTPATPNSTIQGILNAWDMEAGDTVYIDTGVYTNLATTTIGQFDSGSLTSGVRVVFQGSTNYSYGGTVIQGGGRMGVDMVDAMGIELRDLDFRDASTAVRMKRSAVCALEWVRSSGGSIGFELDAAQNCTFRHCSVRSAAVDGLLSAASSNTIWQSGVLWSNANGLHLGWSSNYPGAWVNSVRFSNSIVSVFGSNGYAYRVESGVIDADYNDLYLQGGAYAATVPPTNSPILGSPAVPVLYDSVSRWARDMGRDVHSFTRDPGFANAASGDFHLRSQGGHYQPTNRTFVSDGDTSSLIDGGNPAAAYSAEPTPNGSRLNIGMYGNSAEESKTPTNGGVAILSLNDGGRAEGSSWPLYWEVRGDAAAHTVKLEYSPDAGTTWTTICAGVAASNRVYSWDSTMFTSSVRALWRIASEMDTNVYDVSDRFFALRNVSFNFFVNDNSTNGDVYTTAIGVSTNLGLTPATPKDSIENMLSTWDLEAGDTVYVDTGAYTNSSAVTIGQLDAGGISNQVRVVIQGSTNSTAGGTVIDRRGVANGIEFQQAGGVAVRNLNVQNAISGIQANESDSGLIEWVNVDRGSAGFEFTRSSGMFVRHCSARGASVAGITMGDLLSQNIYWQNGVLWSNAVGAWIQGSGLTFSNSVIAAFGADQYAYYQSLSSTFAPDYNDLYLLEGAGALYRVASPQPFICQNLSRLVRDAGMDRHSLSTNPKFYDSNRGDFHLLSQAGRYNPATRSFVNDAETSPLIDGGNPLATYTNEPTPNGGRLNIGLYGNSSEESRTPTNASLTALSPSDGGRVEGVWPLYWIARGDATGHTVRIQFSADGGSTWVTVDTNLSASAGLYVWDTRLCSSTIRGLWRVVSERNTNVYGQSESLFAVRNQPIPFYVNDSSTNGDVYCTAIGASGNSGVLPSTPKDTAQGILDTWDLEPGDTIYVDTGTYVNEMPTSAIHVTRFDAWEQFTNLVALQNGFATNRMMVQGSTNDAAGGTVLVKFTGDRGAWLDESPGVALRNMTFRLFDYGVYVNEASIGMAEWIRSVEGTIGFMVYRSTSFRMVHCVAQGNSDRGISSYDSDGTEWYSGVLWSNRYGAYQDKGSLAVGNSILGAFTSDSYANFHVSGAWTSDYNDIYLHDDAFACAVMPGGEIGGYTQRYENVALFARETGKDLHTLSFDPKFADLASSDFHLKTTRPSGRFDPFLRVWTNDADFSPLIDNGDPLSAYTNEPAPNGSRIDIGLYGNSTEASKTPSNGWFSIITMNDGGSVKGTVTIRWNAASLGVGQCVYLDFSPDGGIVWTNIVTNLTTASTGSYDWDTSTFGRSAAGLWRIVSCVDTTMVDTSDKFFTMRDNSGSIPYYVNDLSTNGDVYCTTIGNSTNLGIVRYAPAISVQSIIDRFKLEPVDIIYIDTGIYPLTADIVLNDLDSGNATNHVYIQGSTNEAAGGSVLNRQVAGGGTHAIFLNNAVGIELHDLTLETAQDGMLLKKTRDCYIEDVRSQGNSVDGFRAEDATVRVNFNRCASMDNGTTNGYGLTVDQSSVAWSNGVIWGNANAVGFSQAGTNFFRNSVFQASGAGQRIFRMDKQTPTYVVISDYNDLLPINDALIAEQETVQGGSEVYGRLIDWQRGRAQDEHSLSHAPLFANEVQRNFRLQSAQGRFLPEGGMTNDPYTSPLIDLGDPVSVYSNEPSPNGGRINIGNYGNATAASLSLTNPWLLAVTLNDGGTIRGTNMLYWAYGAMTNGTRVRLEFSRNNGIEWNSIASNVLVTSTGYAWDVSTELPSSFCLWRIISESSSNVVDTNDTVFGIKNEPLTVYVNDTNTLGDIYCAAPGDPANSGLSSNAPLSDPAAAVEKYYTLIGAGDVIYVDTGFYALTNTMEFGELTRGLSGAVIRVQGSTNSAYGGSLLDRADTASYAIRLNGTRYVEIDHLRLTGAGNGVQVNNSGNCALSWIECFSNASDGIVINQSTPVSLQQCALRKNVGWGVTVMGQSDVTCDHSVFWTNRSGAVNMQQATVSISNSVLHAYRGNSYVYQVNQNTVQGDFNVLLTEGEAVLARDGYSGAEYRNLHVWQQTRGMDQHSGIFNPLFANADAGDFHVRSEAGRYAGGGSWTTDTNTSWTIDAGSPTAAYAGEPAPNGSRLNAGLYGNTAEASKSVTNLSKKAVLVVALNDGGTVTGTKTLYWLSRAMSPTDTVRIEFSGNGGGWWVVLASNVSATAAGYTWNPSSLSSAQLALWRVILESGAGVADTNDKPFILRNGPMTFYVNDSSRLGDIYTAAIGSSTNDGYTTNTPKSCLQDILNYDLEGGDRVLVDTGYYPLTNDIFISALNSGVSTSLVSLVGSTNLAYGGSILEGQHTNYTDSCGFYLKAASYVMLSDFTVMSCDRAVYLEQDASYNVISNLLIRDNGSVGIRMVNSRNNRFERTVVTRTAGAGISCRGSVGSIASRCVIWTNVGNAVDLVDSSFGISNSVLSANGEGRYCYYRSTNTSLYSDYNVMYAVGGANYGCLAGVPVEAIPQWTAATTQDIHSIGADPLFNNPASDDYHVRSQTGRYDPSIQAYVTTDTNYSYAIDAGNRMSEWTNEPSPNGSRMNIGLYGNTSYASKSRTNEWLMALTASSGGRLEGIFYLVWNAVGMSPTNTVSLDYSFNNGASWTSIVRRVAITNGQYVWNSTEEYSGGVERWPSSPIGRWRVQMDSNTNVYDITDTRFALRNRLFTYYLNDSQTNGDIYTTAVGSDTNLGFYPWNPMATLRALLETNDVEGEDIIKIDTGIYPITTNDLAVLGPADQGKAGLPVEIMGNTNALLSVFDRASVGPEETILTMQGSYVNLQGLVFLGGHMTIQGGNVTLRNIVLTNGDLVLSGPTEEASDVRVDNGGVTANGDPITLSRFTVKDGGFSLSGTNIVLQNSLVYGSNGPAVSVVGSSIALRNNTLAGAGTQFRQGGFGGSTLENNIIVASGAGSYCLLNEGGTLLSDYNDLLARNGAWVGNYLGNWEKLLYWQRASGNDLHSISTDPKFADEAGRDYHLKSVVGRWTGSSWTTDAVQSTCVDAGNPGSEYTNEPSPNGARVNLGAYANTTQASKSQTNAWLVALTVNDGGVLKGTNLLQWQAGNLGTTDLVRLEYSPDNGSSWTTIVSGVSARAQEYLWNSTIFTSSLQALWRIVLVTNPVIADQVDTNFAVRNTPLNFYVNDAFSNGDVYCSSTGTLAGTGLAPSSPKLTVQDLLAAYDTEARDTIYVDTGVYNLSSDIEVIWSRGGDDAYGNVLFRGSTNIAAGGSQIARNSFGPNDDSFDVKASHVTLRDFTVRNGYRGIYFESNYYSSAERILAVSNSFAVVDYATTGTTNFNLRTWNNREGGVDVVGAQSTLVANCTFVGNSNFAVRVRQQSVNNTIENNIFMVLNSNCTALADDGGVLDAAFVDYNIYYFEQTATIYQTYRDLRSWQLSKKHDYRSAVTNPWLANASGGDFHPKSTAGRYVDGSGWVLDGSNSWAIDTGDPLSDFSLEPQTNGDRINIGAFGNTEYASKGSTSALVYARTFNEATVIDDSVVSNVWPLVWTVKNVPRPWLVKVQFSGDGGTNWVNIATGVYAFAEYVLWNTTPYYNTYKGRWRIVSEVDTNYSDMNDSPITIFYGQYAITAERNVDSLNGITWRGAWDETYQVQYSTNMVITNSAAWVNAPTGALSGQVPYFRSTYGGDLTYEDAGTTNSRYRFYRVLWQQ